MSSYHPCIISPLLPKTPSHRLSLPSERSTTQPKQRADTDQPSWSEQSVPMQDVHPHPSSPNQPPWSEPSTPDVSPQQQTLY